MAGFILDHGTIRASLFGISVEAQAPTLTNNTFVATPAAGGFPYSARVSSQSFDLDRLANNSSSGSPAGAAVMMLIGAVGASSTLAAQPMPVVVAGTNHLDVPAGITATIAAGAVFKSVGLNDCSPGVACQITVEEHCERPAPRAIRSSSPRSTTTRSAA